MVSNFLSITFLLVILSSTTTTTTSQADADNSSVVLLRSICAGPQARDPLSFAVNFVQSMEIITQKIAETGFGISTASVNDTERIYGLGQCLKYLSNTDCRLCYAESRVKLPLCLHKTNSRVYLDGCFLRYASYNFTEEVVDDKDTYICGSSKNVSDEVEFRQRTTGLIQNLTGAYEDRNYYREGSVSVSPRVTAYGIAECWRSVNRTACKLCLENARRSVLGCLPRSDGRALNAGCVLRYSTEPFYMYPESPTGGSSSARRRRRLGVALGSIFAAVIVIGGAIIWRRRGSSGDDDYEDVEGYSETMRSISESRLNFGYDVLRDATNNFDPSNKIGQGGYGTVYKGILPDGREIAVKRLFINTTQWLGQFFNEVNLISRVQHKNLVKLFGCSVEGPESLLVYEYLRNTSLDKFLFDSFRKKHLDWGSRFDIIVGTAEGLTYLHQASEVRIIHRDIKASNVLLDERFKPKIADFGLARYFGEGQSHLSTGIAGTIGYMAPEYIVHGQLTEKVDIYSYGVLVLEILTGLKNTSPISTSSEYHSLISKIWRHYTSKTLIEMLDPDLKGQCSEEQVLKVFHVGLLCTQASPNLRPPMWKVVEMLTSTGRNLPPPSQPPYINIKGGEAGSNGFETSNTASSSKYPISVNQMSFSIMQGR